MHSNLKFQRLITVWQWQFRSSRQHLQQSLISFGRSINLVGSTVILQHVIIATTFLTHYFVVCLNTTDYSSVNEFHSDYKRAAFKSEDTFATVEVNIVNHREQWRSLLKRNVIIYDTQGTNFDSYTRILPPCSVTGLDVTISTLRSNSCRWSKCDHKWLQKVVFLFIMTETL